MPGIEHEHEEFPVLHLVDHAVIANTYPQLTAATLELDAARRPGILGERPDRLQ